MDLELGSDTMIHCNLCHQKTHHLLKAVHQRNVEFRRGLNQTWQYRLWVCRGCDTGTLEEVYSDDYTIGGPESRFLPERAVHNLPTKHFVHLRPELKGIYVEVISCYNVGANVLCATGLRALMEGICTEKGVKVRNDLSVSIGRLGRYLPQNIVDSLHSFRFMGNQAAHELRAPDTFELRLAIEVMEDLLNLLYVLEYKARKLLKDEPPPG